VGFRITISKLSMLHRKIISNEEIFENISQFIFIAITIKFEPSFGIEFDIKIMTFRLRL
jgi:hypothetical protein